MEELVRGAGVLMSVSSLPSAYGIGTFGKESYDFVDWLSKAGMRYWQVLPLGITSYGDSPYQSPSAFAGNPYYIDLNGLVKEGLLERRDMKSLEGAPSDHVDYELQYKNRYVILRKAYERFAKRGDLGEFEKYCREEKDWLEDYALFAAIKKSYGDEIVWKDWDDDIKFRKKTAVSYYTKKLSDDVSFYMFLQFLFERDFRKLKAYANSKGIKIIGDMPLYVAYDSADVWSDPKQFLLDDNLELTVVAGCPPDCFSEDGQKWGNPIYDWDYAKKDEYRWFSRRIKRLASLYDIIRIDHFIGIVKYYNVPIDKTAKFGFYKVGPGGALIKAVLDTIGEGRLIAEDLGVYMPQTDKLLKRFDIPNMKVMAFAFDSGAKNPHLPHNHRPNQVIYIGTHDNDTLMGQLSDIEPKTKDYMAKYLGVGEDEILQGMIRALYASVGNVCILQMQDILMKGREGRMNYPSTTSGNWQFRINKDELGASLSRKLKELAIVYGRL